jgi:hypothetical protein
MIFKVTDQSTTKDLVIFCMKHKVTFTVNSRECEVHIDLANWKTLDHDTREEIRDFVRIPFQNLKLEGIHTNRHTQEAQYQLFSRSPQFCEWWHNYCDDKQREQLTRFFAHYWNIESMMEKFSFPSAEIRELARLWRDQILALRKMHKPAPVQGIVDKM